MVSQYKITSSTELMDNYKQAELVSPQKEFYAVQTNDVMALLFSIGTDGVFYLIEQQTEHLTGWEQIDLSSSLSSNHGGEKVTAKTFCVAQNVETQKIDLSLVVTVKNQDYLYLSLGNNNTADAVTPQNISWVAVPYDDPEHAGISPDVAELFIAESSTEEYIVVDISQSTFKTNPTDYISRYYIDIRADQKWNSMTIGGELEPGASSCMGRVAGDRVDGMYTLGNISKTEELLYAPLYNAFDKGAPVTVRRLTVPDGASAIASVNAGNSATDLFAAAEAGLYYFASNNQEDGASGVLVVASDLFNGASSLYALEENGQITLWGLNLRTHQIFYTTCSGEPTSQGDWSVPLPIMSGVEQVAPYLNCGNSANSFFAHTGVGELVYGIKSPDTTIWSRRAVALPPIHSKTKATKFRSYTTRFQVIDKNEQPVVGKAVDITSDSDISVYINNLYYVLGSEPVQVKTDGLGTITVVNAVLTLSGAKLHASIDDTVKSVNPMDKPSQKATQLQSASALSEAVITYQDGSTKKLVKNGVKSDTLKAVANANTQLATAYNQINTMGNVKSSKRMTPKMMAMQPNVAGAGSIWVDVGDLFSWLDHLIGEVGEVIWDAANSVWTYVVEIAGKVYSAVLDTIEAVASAVQAVYNVIVEAVEDLIDFLKFLFELGSMERTKDVIENMIKLYLENQVDQIEVFKQEIDQKIDDMEDAINNWAGMGDLSGLGSEGTATVDQTSKPASDNSAPGALLSYHYQHNARNTSMKSTPPIPSEPDNPVSTLISALENEWDILGDAFDDIYKLAANIGSMSAEDFFKKLTAIIADAVLDSVKNVIDALLDIIYDMAKTALKVLTTPIHIPVVSDILEVLGVPEFSFLDVICWVGAIPVTIAYKIVKGEEPFPDDKYTSALIGAKSFSELEALFPSGSNTELFAKTSSAGTTGIITLPETVATTVFITCHAVAGTSGLISALLDSCEAAEESGDNELVIPAAISAILGGGLQVGSNIFVPKNPINNTAVSWIYRVTSGIRVVCKIIFSGPGQKFLEGKSVLGNLNVQNARGVGSVVDAVLVIPALACSCWHFYELANEDATTSRTDAILDELSNVMAYITRVSYAVAVNTEAEPKYIAIACVAVSDVGYGGLQYAESMVL